MATPLKATTLTQQGALLQPRAFIWTALLYMGFLFGCTAAPEEKPTMPPQGSWIRTVAMHPETFEVLVADDRDGWIAMYEHRYGDAYAQFSQSAPGAQARAAHAQSILYEDFARLSEFAHMAYLEAYASQSSTPTKVPPHIDMVAQWSRECGDPQFQAYWDETSLGKSKALPKITTLPWEQGDKFFQNASLKERTRRHRDGVSGNIEPLLEIATSPITLPTIGKDGSPAYDPCLFRSLYLGWMSKTTHALGGEFPKNAKGWASANNELSGLFLSPWLTSASLESQLSENIHHSIWRSREGLLPTLDALASSSPHEAMESVREMDKTLDGWKEGLLKAAPNDGVALLTELSLIEQFRQHLLCATGRALLRRGAIQVAGAVLTQARDTGSNTIGPSNSPGLFVLLAEVELRKGHTRGSLDVLYPLTTQFPELYGLQELLGDLTVLKGLGRQGVSREE